MYTQIQLTVLACFKAPNTEFNIDENNPSHFYPISLVSL